MTTKAELEKKIAELEEDLDIASEIIQFQLRIMRDRRRKAMGLTAEMERIASSRWVGADHRCPTKWAQKVAKEALERYGW